MTLYNLGKKGYKMAILVLSKSKGLLKHHVLERDEIRVTLGFGAVGVDQQLYQWVLSCNAWSLTTFSILVPFCSNESEWAGLDLMSDPGDWGTFWLPAPPVEKGIQEKGFLRSKSGGYYQGNGGLPQWISTVELKQDISLKSMSYSDH